MGDYKRILLLVLVLMVVAAAIGGTSIYVLYQAAFEEQRSRLAETAQSQARLIEAIAQFDRTYSTDYPGGAESATLSQVVEAHKNYSGFGQTGEFSLARRQGDQVVFLLKQRHADLNKPKPVPIDSSLAEPMRRALSGQSGTMVGLDYRGELVLAAHEPVRAFNMGIVAKIDMDEIRAPFIRAGAVVAGIALFLAGLGSIIFFRVGEPMVRRLRESEERFKDFAEAASDWYWEMGPDLRLSYVSDRIYDILGIEPVALIGKSREELVLREEDRAALEQHLDDLKNHRPFRDFSYSLKRIDGSEVTVSLNGKPIFRSSDGAFLCYRGTGTDITARVEAEQRIARAQGQLIDALESVTDGVVLYDSDDRLVMCNETFREKLAEIGNMLVPGTRREDIVRVIAEHGIVVGIDDVEDYVRDQIARGQKTRLRQFKDGSWMMIRNYPTRDGGTFLVRTDVTELKRMEEAHEEAERRFRDIAESASDWFWEMGPDLRFSFFSDRIRDILGVDPDFYIGKTRDEEALMKEDPELWGKHFDDLKNRRPFRDFQYTIRREDGSGQIIRISGNSVFDEAGVFTGYRGTGTNVTEQVETAEKATQAQRQLYDAMEGIPQGVALFDADDRFVLCNSTYRQYLHDLGHLLVPGTHFKDLVRAIAESGLLREIGDDPEKFIRERMKNHQKLRGALQQQAEDGTWILVHEYRTRDGGTLLVRTDITELKRAEQAVLESEARFKAIAESASDWFWETGPDLRFVYVSERYYAVTGRRPEEIIGKTRSESADEETIAADPEGWRRHMEDLEARRPFNGFIMSSRGGAGSVYAGARYYIKISGKPRFNEQGRYLGYIGAATDITATVKNEQELRMAKEIAEKANRSKSEFLANMSHELRTPLNAIIGFSGTMKERIFGGIGNEKYAEYVNDIHDSGSHLLELINDILDVSVIEAGKLELDERQMSVAGVAKAALRLVKSRAQKGGVRLVNNVSNDLPGLFGDERRIKQILLNLLTNAIKFTADGGTVSISGSLGDDGSLTITVGDTGVGMNEADIAKAFSPFGQADSTIAKKEEGTGLGLPLSKGLAEAHGGTLNLTSASGEGTVAKVHFPAERVFKGKARTAIN